MLFFAFCLFLFGLKHIYFTTVGANEACQCGVKSSVARIVGGVEANKNEYPWMVALCEGYCDFNTQYCGATLINDLYCVTAAHCVKNKIISKLYVSLGDYDISTRKETTSVELRITEIIVHQNYEPGSEKNDIALLKLSAPVKISEQIKPICLPTTGEIYSKKLATAVGWGAITAGGLHPAILREVTVKIIANQLCNKRYNSTTKIAHTMLCASSMARDTCQGDSGGPLILNVKGRMELIGITSFGVGCGNTKFPGVYTRVAKFVTWIKSKTVGSIYCS